MAQATSRSGRRRNSRAKEQRLCPPPQSPGMPAGDAPHVAVGGGRTAWRASRDAPPWLDGNGSVELVRLLGLPGPAVQDRGPQPARAWAPRTGHTGSETATVQRRELRRRPSCSHLRARPPGSDRRRLFDGRSRDPDAGPATSEPFGRHRPLRYRGFLLQAIVTPPCGTGDRTCRIGGGTNLARRSVHFPSLATGPPRTGRRTPPGAGLTTSKLCVKLRRVRQWHPWP
jgi:hypothetical protein